MEKPKGKYAWTVKVGERGQFVVPKEARDLFNINPGDTLIVLGDIEQGIAIPPKGAFEGLLNQIFGGNLPEGD
jgi:AbrB family looped-hinge helix DNA binding protein